MTQFINAILSYSYFVILLTPYFMMQIYIPQFYDAILYTSIL